MYTSQTHQPSDNRAVSESIIGSILPSYVDSINVPLKIQGTSLNDMHTPQILNSVTSHDIVFRRKSH